MDTIFTSLFFSRSMNQLFNQVGAKQPLDENEAPIHRMLRFAGQL